MKINTLPSNVNEANLRSRVERICIETEVPQFASQTTINNGWGKAILVVTNHRILTLNKDNFDILEGTTWISNLVNVNYSIGSLTLKADGDKFRHYGLKNREFSVDVQDYLLQRSKEIYENGNAPEVVGLMPWSTRDERVTEEQFNKELSEQQTETNGNQPNVNSQNIAKLGILGAFLLGGDE